MLGVYLHWTTCRDGIGIADRPDWDPRDRALNLEGKYRTKRTKRLRFHLTNLSDPLVLRYANAHTIEMMRAFYSENGLPYLGEDSPVFRPAAVPQSGLFQSLLKCGAGPHHPRAEEANTILQRHRLRPRLAVTGKRGLAIEFEINSLRNYMELECVAIAQAGALLVQCPVDGKFFLKGPLTGRRIDTKTCSDRCRMKASRLKASQSGRR